MTARYDSNVYGIAANHLSEMDIDCTNRDSVGKVRINVTVRERRDWSEGDEGHDFGHDSRDLGHDSRDLGHDSRDLGHDSRDFGHNGDLGA